MHYAYPKGGYGRAFCLESGAHNHGLQATKVVCLFQKKFGRVVKNYPTCSDDLTGEKHFSKFSSLSSLLDYEQTLFTKLTEILRAGLPKLPSTVSENFFSFCTFGMWAKTFFRILAKKLNGWVAETALLRNQRSLKEGNFLTRNFFVISFWLWADDLRD